MTQALVDRHIISHYSDALNRIGTAGLYSTLAQTCQPYLAAVWENFSSGKSTITEDVLSGKLAGTAWTAARRWLGTRPRNPSSPPPDSPEPR